MPSLKWSANEVLDYLHDEFPLAFDGGRHYEIEEMTAATIRVSSQTLAGDLRPGETVSGPALMRLVDVSIYFLLLGLHGEGAKMAVTTNLQMSFLRKAGAGRLVCDVELIKNGRKLSVGVARISEAASGRLIANSEATYFMAGTE